jgi:hypothetical protein
MPRAREGHREYVALELAAFVVLGNDRDAQVVEQ